MAEQGRLVGPVASMRLENIRDGIEDYQYLHLSAKMAGAFWTFWGHLTQLDRATASDQG